MTHKTFGHPFLLPFLALFLIAALGVGCSGCGGAAEADTAGAAAGTEHDASADHDAMDHDDHDHDGHDHDGMGPDHDAADGADATGSNDPWQRTYDSPAAERAGTVENLQGLRATLVAELESVRGRLKDGTRAAEDRKSDTQRAAELAQGLERLDRTIKQISEANDVTWTEVRDSEMKAAGEFREWMAKYGMAS